MHVESLVSPEDIKFPENTLTRTEIEFPAVDLLDQIAPASVSVEGAGTIIDPALKQLSSALMFKEARKYKLLELQDKLPSGRVNFDSTSGSRNPMLPFDWSTLTSAVYGHDPCTMTLPFYQFFQDQKWRRSSFLGLVRTKLLVWVKSMGLLPFIMNGKLFLIQALIVEDIFPQQPVYIIALGRGSVLMPFIGSTQQSQIGCLDISDGEATFRWFHLQPMDPANNEEPVRITHKNDCTEFCYLARDMTWELKKWKYLGAKIPKMAMPG
ncbi:hypothetical protein EV426DRAFT_703062 [Tirmania nivea]|nr:hypothetical protein EV426DRAFT_703062 [Tirmania nivea]